VLRTARKEKRKCKCRILSIVTVALAAALSVPGATQAQPAWAQVGQLNCTVKPNAGFIIYGHKPMDCQFTPLPNDPTPPMPQNYDGAINTVGLNIGVSAGSQLVWAVFAPTKGVQQGALAGEYVGVTGDIGIGLGAGANLLLGGSGRTFALQQLSIQGSKAASRVVLGVSALKLRPAL
jgi:hypothetical protein